MEGFRSDSLTMLFQTQIHQRFTLLKKIRIQLSIKPHPCFFLSVSNNASPLLTSDSLYSPRPAYNKECWNFDLKRLKIYCLVWFCWGCFKTCDCTGAWKKGNPLLPRANGICPFHLLIACH